MATLLIAYRTTAAACQRPECPSHEEVGAREGLEPDKVWNHEDKDEGDAVGENSREFGVRVSLGQHAKGGRVVDSEEP
ncbi:hypothetical protein MY10362_006482 [Beauveria mimosiformis]